MSRYVHAHSQLISLIAQRLQDEGSALEDAQRAGLLHQLDLSMDLVARASRDECATWRNLPQSHASVLAASKLLGAPCTTPVAIPVAPLDAATPASILRARWI